MAVAYPVDAKLTDLFPQIADTKWPPAGAALFRQKGQSWCRCE
jgi:hypothetical protein